MDLDRYGDKVNDLTRQEDTATPLAGVRNGGLAIGSVIAAGLAGIEQRLTLPAETTGDPATHQQTARPVPTVQRLPETPGQALAALRRSQVIPAAMGPVLYDAFTAVREAESETFGGQDPQAVAEAHRWRY